MSYGRPPPRIDGMVSLKVDNLTYRTTPEDLRRVFERCGEVGDIYIPRDRYTRESRGFAFVRQVQFHKLILNLFYDVISLPAKNTMEPLRSTCKSSCYDVSSLRNSFLIGFTTGGMLKKLWTHWMAVCWMAGSFGCKWLATDAPHHLIEADTTVDAGK